MINPSALLRHDRSAPRVRWGQIALACIGIGLSLWPFYALQYVNTRALTDALLPVFPLFIGFLVLALTIQRDAGWLQRQNWRIINIERRLAKRSLDRQILLLFLYILTLLLMLVAIGLESGVLVDYISKLYLFSASLALYMTLFLPIEIRRIRILSYDDLIGEKTEARRAA